MDRLLPCPFCGSPAYEARLTDGRVVVSCQKPVLDCPGSYIATSPEQWNTRHAPEGWQLVPVRPTDDMSQAGEDSYGNPHDCDGLDCEVIYEAMLAAAPKWGGE